MNIKPDRIRELRKRRKLSRDDLAAKAKISKRQIARLEKDTESPKRVREYTLMQLAEHLKVDQGVLTGELPMPKPEKTANEKDRVPITALMMSDTRLAYGLIKTALRD